MEQGTVKFWFLLVLFVATFCIMLFAVFPNFVPVSYVADFFLPADSVRLPFLFTVIDFFILVVLVPVAATLWASGKMRS